MLSKLKRIMRQLGRSKPGRRFVDHYHRNNRTETKTAWKSFLVVTLGVLMVAAGLVLALWPVLPGFLFWIPGFALIASQIKSVAVMLDKLECATRDVYRKIKRRVSHRRL